MLTDYVTIGNSGLRVSPFCLGAMTFGEDWGWGSSVAESEAIIVALPRARRQFHRHRQRLHQGPLREDHRRLHRPRRRQARPRRHRHQVLRQPVSRRSQRRRRRPQDDRRLVRAVAAPPADRLHRSLLDALLGSPHADRRDDARARRSRRGRQGALHRLLGHAGVEGRAGADDRALPRLGAAGRAADRVLAARAHRRRRADPDGAGAGPRRHAVVAAEERRALGQVHARQRRARSRPIAASG